MSFVKKLFAGLIASTVLIAWAQTESDDAAQDELQTVGVSLPNYEYLERITNFRGPYTDQDDPVLLKAQQKKPIVPVSIHESLFAGPPTIAGTNRG